MDRIIQVDKLEQLIWKVFWGIVGSIGVLLLSASVSSYEFFHLDTEINLPTWFSSSLLLVVSLIAFVVNRLTCDRSKKVWGFIASVFLFLSMDETAMVHERISQKAAPLLGFENFHGVWLWFYVPFFIMACIYTFSIAKDLFNKNRREFWLCLSAVSLWGFTFMFEFIGQKYLKGGAFYNIELLFEEGFEMLGSAIFFLGFALIAKSKTADCLTDNR